VIVGQDDRGGATIQGELDHFPWVNCGTVDGPSKQLIKTDYLDNVILASSRANDGLFLKPVFFELAFA